MKLRYARGALADLEEIFSYIAQDDMQAAARLVARIEHVTALIAERPQLGKTIRQTRFRQFPVGRYLIVYEVGADEVVVHYVRHGARRRPWEEE